MLRTIFFPSLALLLVLCVELAAAPATSPWRAAGEPVAAGIGRAVACSGHGCPANPPETGPACWWYSYGLTAAGSAGRLACLSPGDHYLEGLKGLKISVAASAQPATLLDPAPLPDPDAPLLPPAPDAASSQPVKLLAVIAGLLALLFFWARPRWPAWQLQRAVAAYARTPSSGTLEILAVRIHKIHRQTGGEIAAPLNEHLRQLDAARFGNRPLAAEALAYFSRTPAPRLRGRA